METNTIFERWNRNQLNVTYGVIGAEVSFSHVHT